MAPGSMVAIVPAAGRGQRFGAAHNKLFAMLRDEPLWVHAARKLAAREEIAKVIVAVSAADESVFRSQAKNATLSNVVFCRGGAERFDSVAAALATLENDGRIQFVAVHDAARPLVTNHDLTAVFTAAAQNDAAILSTPITGSVKRYAHSMTHSVDRRDLFLALTPQVFRFEILCRAYARHRGYPVTDDSQLVEQMGHRVVLVPGSANNLKITLPEDLALAEALLDQHAQL